MHNRRMAKIIERTKQDGSKVWQVNWREGDRQLAETFDNKAEAEALAAKLH